MTTVLVVDDNAETLALYSHYLAYVGMATHGAADGVEALKQAKHVRPDVIVMDLHIPRQDGIQTMRKLKAGADTNDIPVIALTGDLTLEDDARDAYCAAFLRKPCLPEQLAAAIVKVVADGRRSRRPRGGAARSAAASRTGRKPRTTRAKVDSTGDRAASRSRRA